MKQLERLTLIDRIGRELQARMSYRDIDRYLQGFSIDISRPTSGVNSKWVYTKDRLADVPPETIVRIADELSIPHGYTITTAKDVTQSLFWEPFHFRLFLSHLSSFKKPTAALQAALRRYGISAFVAHVDIEPTKEWQDEIEAGLNSMDAMAAILMPGFKESNWTDQEVGFAMGRGVLIIPIMRGATQYGFIGKYQGLQANGKTVAQVAAGVFEVLVLSEQTQNRMLSCLIDTTLRAASVDEALEKLGHLASVADLPTPQLERLREGAATSSIFTSGEALGRLNEMLTRRGFTKVGPEEPGLSSFEGDVPF